MLVRRFFPICEDSYFLMGPRGTGKSTLVQQHHPDGYFINLLDPSLVRELMAHPEKLLHWVRPLPENQTVIIDEIQIIPELLSLVHWLIEENPKRQFVLTGSSARKLRKSGVNLLGGRALSKTMHPFMAAELGDQFNPEHALRYGMLPLCHQHHDPAERLEAYVHLYLEEEVKAESLVRQIQPFARFLEALSFSHGTSPNFSHISRESGVKRSTIDLWYGIIHDLLIGFEVPVFTKRAKRRLIQKPKFYYFDTGVYRTLRPSSVYDPQTEFSGPALEGLIAQHLRAWCAYSRGHHQLYYWRTTTQLEVDFIVLGPLGWWAIEVKQARTISPGDLAGLKAFMKDFPEATPLLLYGGERLEDREGILCVPWTDFLRCLIPNQEISSRKHA